MIELNVLNDNAIDMDVIEDEPVSLLVNMPTGGGITPSGTKSISITANGTYTEDVTVYANAEIDVNVSGGITPSGTKNISITANGTTTEDVTNYANAQITANVPNTYTASDEGKVVDDGALVSQTSKSITANGTHDTTTNNSVTVAVANSYTSADEGKVVDNGALVAQGSQTITENGTYDTTLVDDVTVNVSGGGSDTIYWKGARNQQITIAGIWDCKNFDIDFNNVAMNIPNFSYVGTTADADKKGSVTFKNVSSSITTAQMTQNDLFRQSPSFSEIDLGGIAPSGITRWFYQWEYSPNNKFVTAPITVRNLKLDNLASNNNGFYTGDPNSRYYQGFTVYFLGELKNSINISGWTKLNADSWNRLIECLYDYSEGDAHTLTVGSTILAMIDSTHQALATSRGWTLA